MSLPTAQTELEIPFHDVDIMGVAWHGHYLRYFEIARCALLRGFDYDYPQMRESGYAWPVVECQVKYVRSLLYGQRVSIRAELVEYENRLKIVYEIRDIATNELLTRGHTVQVAIAVETQELQFVSPPVLFEKLKRP